MIISVSSQQIGWHPRQISVNVFWLFFVFITDDEDLEFDTWRGKEMFPPLPCDPTSKTWDYEARRGYLRTCFNRPGFYKGSFKSIKEPSHCPDGFPSDKLSWETFGKKGGPNGCRKQDADKIIQAFFDHYMPGTRMSTYYRGYVQVQEDVSDDQSRRSSIQPVPMIQPPLPSEQEDFNDGHVQEDGGESEQEDKDGEHHEDQEIEKSGSELDDSELDKYYEQMSDDIVAEEEMINDEESNVPRTPEVPANSFDNTVLFDRSAGKKRALNILEQSGSETDNDGSTFIEYDNQEKKKRDEEIPPYMQLRLNNIAARDAAMKAAEEAGLF